MKKKTTYLIALTLLAASCASDGIGNDTQTLSGDDTKTPLAVTALLDAGGASTRATDNLFDTQTGDQLLAYVRHVKWEGTSTDDRNIVNNGNFDKLVSFTAKENTAYTGDDIKPIGLGGTVVVATKTGDVTNQSSVTADPAIFWDDFSANSSVDGTETSTYLRDDKHYLQSYYGYCFNGGEGDNNSEGTTVQNHITTALSETAGILGWKVDNNQSSTNTDTKAFQHSDLLWSAEQTPIKYAHVDGQGNRVHGTLVLPYTHAMSKVTINVTIDETFGTSGVNFSGVKTILHEMFTTCTCTAPTYTLSNKGTATVGGTEDVTMKNEKSGDNTAVTTCKFEAIVVPSVLSVVNNLATIEGLDGNNYVIPITENMLQQGYDAQNNKIGWGWELTETEEHISGGTAQAPPRTRTTSIDLGKGYEMKSGVNYVLNVNISKQDITVSATIKNWQNVEASGKGIIVFNNDVNGTGTIHDDLKNGFDVYKSSVNTAFSEKTTTLSWDQTNSKWRYNPVIYWGGQEDASYFRALWPAGQGTNMSQNTDLLWGYACDDPNNVSKVGTAAEVAITPRTGDVPLEFIHPMSKITVNLKTSTGDPTSVTSPAVDLTDAKIEISNLAISGTLDLATGNIQPSSIVTEAIPKTTSISEKIVIPQTLGNDAILKITLKDGTTYKVNLNKCYVNDGDDIDANNVLINAWERNKHYTYTIQVDKEAIIFRGMVKDWDPVKGSGSANLDWDYTE